MLPHCCSVYQGGLWPCLPSCWHNMLVVRQCMLRKGFLYNSLLYMMVCSSDRQAQVCAPAGLHLATDKLIGVTRSIQDNPLTILSRIRLLPVPQLEEIRSFTFYGYQSRGSWERCQLSMLTGQPDHAAHAWLTSRPSWRAAQCQCQCPAHEPRHSQQQDQPAAGDAHAVLQLHACAHTRNNRMERQYRTLIAARH
jgi:hypothetical protein